MIVTAPTTEGPAGDSSQYRCPQTNEVQQRESVKILVEVMAV
jgi:hypothetical protein